MQNIVNRLLHFKDHTSTTFTLQQTKTNNFENQFIFIQL